ncbi:MAG: hypothetical protein GX442_08600 [Candidatus Riflebacteria bacterium]|nr:hypothetical protein [Candidatus Riflebacteria bacterium]
MRFTFVFGLLLAGLLPLAAVAADPLPPALPPPPGFGPPPNAALLHPAGPATAPAATGFPTPSPGPLAAKAALFDQALETLHTPLGMVLSVETSPAGLVTRVRPGGDATIWTGAWLAAQAFRYRVTRDPAALSNIERGLLAFHTLNLLSGNQGFMGRCFGPAEWFGPSSDARPGLGPYAHLRFIPDSSRDQYTGIFLAYTTCLPLVTDPALLDTIRGDLLAVGRNLAANRLALRVTLGSDTFSPFNLNPDYAYQDRITPEEWARVDDFPVNVFARIVPYSPALAEVIGTFQPPPVRGGEALRALMIMQTAAHFTGDAGLQRFFSEELVANRRFPDIASTTSQLLGDLYEGRGQETGRQVCRDLAVALLRLLREAAVRLGRLPAPVADLGFAAARPWAVGVGHAAGSALVAALDALRAPAAFAPLAALADTLDSWARPLTGLGAGRPAGRLTALAAWLRRAAASSLDELADAQRSYVGTNLTFFALLGLFEGPTDPALRAAAADIVDRAFAPIADEGNTLYTFIRHINGTRPLPPGILAQAKATLLAYPADQHARRIDHHADPGLRLLPWPDRFGRIGNQAVDPFPVDQRAPHVFIWQEPPRAVTTGHDDTCLIPPVGYLLAYWYGRAHGLLSADD